MAHRSHACRAAAVLAAIVCCAAALAAGTADTVDALWERGKAQITAGNVDEALKTAEQAVAAAPESADAWWLMGWVRECRGEWEQAEQSYRKGADLGPEIAALHNNVGWALQMLGRPEEAVAPLERAVAVDPAYSQAHINLGIVLEQCGRPDDASASFARVIEIGGDPRLVADAHNLTGYLHANKAEWDRALREIRVALSHFPGDAGYLDSLGSIAALAGDLGNAEAMLRRALQTPGALLSSRAALAYCHALRGDQEKARAQLDKVSERLVLEGPEMSADTIYFAALAYGRLGDNTRAQELATAFCKRWPKLKWASDLQGLAP